MNTQYGPLFYLSRVSFSCLPQPKWPFCEYCLVQFLLILFVSSLPVLFLYLCLFQHLPFCKQNSAWLSVKNLSCSCSCLVVLKVPTFLSVFVKNAVVSFLPFTCLNPHLIPFLKNLGLGFHLVLTFAKWHLLIHLNYHL